MIDALELFYNDKEAFPERDFAPTIGLGLKSTVNVPVLPTSQGTTLDAAIVIAGSEVAGRGMIPLGLTAGTDTNDECGAPCTKDGKAVGIDVLSDNPVKLAYHDDGKLNLRMAPNHDGIEGSRYGVVTIALPTSGTLANGAMLGLALHRFRQAAKLMGKEMILAGISIKNTDSKPLWYIYSVAFFDKEGKMVGAASSPCFLPEGLAPGNTQRQACSAIKSVRVKP